MCAITALYDEDRLANLAQKQRTHAWDLEKSIPWNQSLDLNKPLVALDEHAILFPGASTEQRLAISQMMGLIIAACICEMEETLERLRKECFENVIEKMPVCPEFKELGDLFFSEEQKHSQAFRRYLSLYAAQTNIDLKTLLSILPVVEKTRSEFILRQNLKKGGLAFWWIVAIVEQEFLILHHSLKPHEKDLEPLYACLHEKHFEEETRHSPFPYMMLELLATRSPQLLSSVFRHTDLALAQLLQSIWAIHSLGKLKQVKKLKHVHPLFEVLASAYPLLEQQPPYLLLWKMFTRAPYVGSLLNIQTHKQIIRFSQSIGALRVYFPEYECEPLMKR